MQVTLHARVPSEDAAQRLLFSSDVSSAEIYSGGHFRSDAAVARRLAHLDGRASARGIGSATGPITAVSLQELLRHENAFAPLTPEQRANLEAAGSERAVFVLTGQQPGLFGGPVLWYYKALTCAALAREWAAKLGRPVIPIFWAAGDDADLRECNHLELLETQAEAVPTPWSLDFSDAARTIPMSERKVAAEGLSDLLARLESLWNAETVEGLRRCYPTPSTLTSGFLRLAQSHLGREGILFVDGYSHRVRALARPVLEAAVCNWDEYHNALKQGTMALEAAGLKAQVSLRPGVVHAFALMNGERHRLFGESPAQGTKVYTAEQPLHDLLPQLAQLELTHDVFTRPLVADAIFPVLGHVLGPAELRYFGQMPKLFLGTTGDMPLVHPRMTAMAVPFSSATAFRNYELEPPALARMTPSALRAKLTERTWRAHPGSSALSAAPGERWLEGLRKVHARHFRDAGPMERFERTMGMAWKRYLRSLERMAFAGSADYHSELFSHLRWLGNGMGQDRHMNLPSLLNALGRDGLAALRAAADPVSTDIQLFLYEADKIP